MMYKKIVMITFFSFSLFGTSVFAGGQDGRLKELIDQLDGKTCKFEIQGNTCVNRPPFAAFFRRSDKEQCIIDSARALGMMGSQAKGALPALIEALKKHFNVDTGDGVIPVHSEIEAAIKKINE